MRTRFAPGEWLLTALLMADLVQPVQSDPQHNPGNITRQQRNTLLADAIVGGNPAQVKQLLKQGVNPNAPTTRSDLRDSFATPLIYAVTYRRPDIVTLLLDAGADVNGLSAQFNSDSWQASLEDTPLAAAAYGDDIPMTRLLLHRGANINGGASRRFTPLMSALFDSDPRAVSVARLLISRGVDVNRSDANGFTPLMLSRSHPEITRLLLAHGAEVNARARDGSTALMLAARGNGKPSGTTPVLRLLLTHGADVRVRDNKGATALMQASNPLAKALLRHAENALGRVH